MQVWRILTWKPRKPTKIDHTNKLRSVSTVLSWLIALAAGSCRASLRCARAFGRAARKLFFAYPALIPQRASAPRKRGRAIIGRPAKAGLGFGEGRRIVVIGNGRCRGSIQGRPRQDTQLSGLDLSACPMRVQRARAAKSCRNAPEKASPLCRRPSRSKAERQQTFLNLFVSPPTGISFVTANVTQGLTTPASQNRACRGPGPHLG